MSIAGRSAQGLRALGLLAMGLLVGCGANREARHLEGRYDLGTPGVGWRWVKPGGADKAWLNSELGATIYGDSNCATRFEDGALGDLLSHLTFGIAHAEPLREEQLTLDGRDAMLRVVDGSMDGVPIRVGAAVVKKDDCVYDFLYIAPPARFDAGWADFVTVLDGFRTRG